MLDKKNVRGKMKALKDIASRTLAVDMFLLPIDVASLKKVNCPTPLYAGSGISTNDSFRLIFKCHPS